MNQLPNITRPCSNCPFRKDCQRGWLGEKRAEEIIQAENFVCHKTTLPGKQRMQCAGHMLLRRDKNLFFAMATRLGLPLLLKGDELVFEKPEDCVEHHKKE